MDYEGDAPQEYEQIPWSHLVPVKQDRSLQLALIAVAAVAVLLAGLFVMRRNPAAPQTAVATTLAAPAPEVAPPPAPVTTMPLSNDVVEGVLGPQHDATAPQIYSEADLMAVLPQPSPDLELLAIASAELFVADYFTVDGDPGRSEAVGNSLPYAVELPDTDGRLISYVEWVRAVAVEVVDRGGYVVTVWFRTLVGDESGGFSRTEVRAVDVELEVDDLGRIAVADLPLVQTVTPGGLASPWPESATPPAEIVAAAVESVADFGSAPELAAAGQDADGWRLVFDVGDASGLRFPIVVRVPAAP